MLYAHQSILEDGLHKMVVDDVNKNSEARTIKYFFLSVCQYDDRVVRLLIERIEVKQDGKLEVLFKYK